MLLLHALLFSLLATSTLAIPVTSVTAPTEEAAKSPFRSWFNGSLGKIKKFINYKGEPEFPDRINGYWRTINKVVSEHQSFYLTQY